MEAKWASCLERRLGKASHACALQARYILALFMREWRPRAEAWPRGNGPGVAALGGWG